MGRLIGFRTRRAGVPEFEEALARLSDELILTENFAGAMIRQGHYQAALGAIIEQQSRLAVAHKTMRLAFKPKLRKVQVALGGIAAALLIGGASFAAIAINSGSAPASGHDAIHAAEQKIARATQVTDESAGDLVTAAIQDLTTAGVDPHDLTYRRQLKILLEGALGDLLSERPQILRAPVGKQLAELARKVKADVEVPDAPTPPPSHEPHPKHTTAPPPPPPTAAPQP